LASFNLAGLVLFRCSIFPVCKELKTNSSDNGGEVLNVFLADVSCCTAHRLQALRVKAQKIIS
jgi:hypothetical protein